MKEKRNQSSTPLPHCKSCDSVKSDSDYTIYKAGIVKSVLVGEHVLLWIITQLVSELCFLYCVKSFFCCTQG